MTKVPKCWICNSNAIWKTSSYVVFMWYHRYRELGDCNFFVVGNLCLDTAKIW